MPVVFSADAEQRQALAREHALESVERLHVDLLVEPWRSEGARVTGRVTADIIQICVVTAEPLSNEVDARIEALFVPAGSRLATPRVQTGELVLDPEGEDAPELFEGDTIDVGQLAEEFFALQVDPYPRKPGAELARPAEGDTDGPLGAKLRSLKDGS
jgi:hypothetical protein